MASLSMAEIASSSAAPISTKAEVSMAGQSRVAELESLCSKLRNDASLARKDAVKERNAKKELQLLYESALNAKRIAEATARQSVRNSDECTAELQIVKDKLCSTESDLHILEAKFAMRVAADRSPLAGAWKTYATIARQALRDITARATLKRSAKITPVETIEETPAAPEKPKAIEPDLTPLQRYTQKDLAKLFDESGMNQTEFAAALGVSRPQTRRMIKGERRITAEMNDKIAALAERMKDRQAFEATEVLANAVHPVDKAGRLWKSTIVIDGKKLKHALNQNPLSIPKIAAKANTSPSNLHTVAERGTIKVDLAVALVEIVGSTDWIKRGKPKKPAPPPPKIPRREKEKAELKSRDPAKVKAGARLKKARKDAGMTAAQMAELLEIIPNTYMRYESGVRGISTEKAEAIGSLLGCEPGKFLAHAG